MTITEVLEHALVDGAVHRDVLVSHRAGRFTEVDLAPGPDVVRRHLRVAGLTIPGLANCHSHAFHRALRARTQQGSGSFWTWREAMYAAAARLEPARYRRLAAAVFGEMRAAGITTVGEFHYVHQRPDGTPYDDPNAMGLALVDAAAAAGVRLTLLDTCYLAAGFGRPPEGVQVRFSDGSADRWRRRVDALTAAVGDRAVVGAAIHSVRAVPEAELATVAGWAQERGAPLHVHLSEQVAENQECLAATGRTPTQLLADAGVLTDRTTVVHATHLTEQDVAVLGAARVRACFCPTTERDLADGIGPARALQGAGAVLTLGSDSHAVIDLLEEARALELHERLVTQRRGHLGAAALLAATSYDGQASLGFPDAGRIAVGQRADLVTLDLRSPRTAGCGASADTAVFAATSADVVRTVVDGQPPVVADPGRVGVRLAAALAAIG